MQTIRKLLALPPRERFLLVQAWWLFLLIELALRVLPFNQVLAFCQKARMGRRDKPGLESDPPVARLAWLVTVAGRYNLVTATCLKQALVLSWILGKQGVDTKLQIGVSRDQGAFSAHAWLERDGQVILGQTERDIYQPLLRT